PRLLITALPFAMLAMVASPERVYTQAAQARPAPQARPAWAWKPAIPTVKAGELEILHVRGNVYMLLGAGGNITVLKGSEGVLMVDTGTAAMSAKVLAAVRSLEKEPIRYIVNTN